MTGEQTGFAEWAHLEAMGHRGHWGLVAEQVIAGAAFLRVEVYAIGDEAPRKTYFYPPSSIYCLTPASEATCRLSSTPYADRPTAAIEAAIEVEDFDDDDLAEDDLCRRPRCEQARAVRGLPARDMDQTLTLRLQWRLRWTSGDLVPAVVIEQPRTNAYTGRALKPTRLFVLVGDEGMPDLLRQVADLIDPDGPEIVDSAAAAS